MRWSEHREGDKKIVKKFLLLPLTINYETRWLETVTIECRYKEYFYDCWVPIRFLDNMEEKTSENS